MVTDPINMINLLDLINSVSQTDDVQDVSAGKVDLLAPGGGGGRLTAPTPGPSPPRWLCA